MAKGSAASLQGEQRDVTIIFTDIRGFTSLTEKLQPTQVVELLGSYFTPMTAIGDTVNTASRVEGMCSKYGSGAVVSGETRALCADDFAWQRIDTVRVKGRTQGVELWQPMTFDEAAARKDELERWSEAFAHYENGEFSEARKICTQLAEKFDKIKLYKIFEERCAELMENAPENWDGILKYDTK